MLNSSLFILHLFWGLSIFFGLAAWLRQAQPAASPTKIATRPPAQFGLAISGFLAILPSLPPETYGSRAKMAKTTHGFALISACVLAPGRV